MNLRRRKINRKADKAFIENSKNLTALHFRKFSKLPKNGQLNILDFSMYSNAVPLRSTDLLLLLLFKLYSNATFLSLLEMAITFRVHSLQEIEIHTT